ncbi:MAG: sulfotransferase [Geminicoccaceae bacterium]|nr:sulfotransferase [Geminicoccaceae bacterium]
MNNRQRYLFIAGNARSGTTALTELVNSHPSIVAGMERYFNLASPARCGELVSELFDNRRFFDPSPDETHNFRWRDDAKYVAFLRDKYARAEIVGDKVPNYFWHAERLFEIFPRSRMLLITRHPLRVADSWKRRQVDASDLNWEAGAADALRQWNLGHEKMVELVLRYGSRFGVVVYEDLFSGAMHHFNRLLSWLDAGPPSEWTMSFHKRATGGWSEREDRDLLLTDAEQEMVVDGARFDLRERLVRLAGI